MVTDKRIYVADAGGSGKPEVRGRSVRFALSSAELIQNLLALVKGRPGTGDLMSLRN